MIRKKKFVRRKKKNTVSHKNGKTKYPNIVANAVAKKKNSNLAIMHIHVHKNCLAKRDLGGVQRILSPFHKFEMTPVNRNVQWKPKVTNVINPTLKDGLSPKEKSYLLCSFQNKTTRYARLKAFACEAAKANKVFFMRTPCRAIREALIERGWVEKLSPERMDLNRIRNQKCSDSGELQCELEKILLASFVDKCQPSFVWNARDDLDATKYTSNKRAIFSRLNTFPLWTSKQGLCASMKGYHWYYIEDVSEINSPRTYTSFDEGEKEEFEKDYKLTACTSLLKWVLSMIANDRPIFSERGGIAINVLVFALNRCKEYLFRKQNKDIDKFCVTNVTSGQWKAFLKKYSQLIAKEDTFTVDKENKLPIYFGYAKFLLKEIHKYRPQLSCEGCHDIWIIKPTHCSRGRGIKMASKFSVLCDMLNKGKFVFQKYIEEPLLVHDTKFDIRQYYLISSTYPLVIWMYKDCYLKFSSQTYSLKNFHESIHLTNNAVQKKYKNCEGRHPELPHNNMWDLETYREYLNRIGKEDVWDTVIYPGMKKSIVGTMLSCQESMSDNRRRFELYGCDFILDKDYKPWLIEINSSPDLNPTTTVTAKICPDVLRDVIKVVIDRPSNSNASTGQFECIYRQVLTPVQIGTTVDLAVRGYSLPLDYFYRGNIKLDSSMENDQMHKQTDIYAMLRKLKQLHDIDIMKELDNSDSAEQKPRSSRKHDAYTSSKTSISDEDLNAVVTVITEQLDSLLSRLPSNSSYSSKRYHAELSPIISSPSSINFAKKVIDNQSVSMTPTRLASHQNMLRESNNLSGTESFHYTGREPFFFSMLDDGPNGKGSGSCCQDLIEKPPFKIPSESPPPPSCDSSTDEIKKLKRNKIADQSVAINSIREATQKIIDFLREKEMECMH